MVIIVVALAIRLAVAPFTGHPFDLNVWINTGKYIVEGKSPYDLYNHLGYPPLWGLWTAFAYWISSLISKSVYLYIFFIKLPIVLADFGVAYYLWKLSAARSESHSFQSNTNKWSASLQPSKLGNTLAATYLLSPFTIIIGSVWGMMDNLAVLLIMLAVFSMFRKGDMLAGIFLGLAISLKLYPLILAPVFLIYLAKERDDKIKRLVSFSGVLALSTAATSLLPFSIFNWNLSGLEGTMTAQLGRIPGGISPLGWLASLNDLNVQSIGSFSLSEIMKSTMVREAWIAVILAVYVWLLTRTKAKDIRAFLTQLMLVMVTWYLSAPWASEPNVLVFLYLLLLSVALHPALVDKYLRVYWIVSGIALVFVLFNVPVTSFVWPVYDITFSGELYIHTRALVLLSVGIAFGLYSGLQCIHLFRSYKDQSNEAFVKRSMHSSSPKIESIDSHKVELPGKYQRERNTEFLGVEDNW